MASARLTVTPISGALGAEVSGIDPAQPLDPATIAELRRIWLAHLVIFFRDQTLDAEQFLAFAKTIGAPMQYPFLEGIPGFPVITQVAKEAHERVNFGGVWHSDTTYLEKPPMATLLIARELPPAGGDTLFANMYHAYETLSDGLKRMLGGMRAISSSAKAVVSRTREDLRRGHGRPDAKDQSAKHPVVRVHPETGRKALYINRAHTARFEDMTEEESAPLLNYLFEHQTQAEMTCRFNWRPGSLALWDNRCTQHYPVNDYHGYRRVMHRITLVGDQPV